MEQYGWICPKCGRVYSPTQSMCLYCGPGRLGLTGIGISDSTSPSEEELKKYTNTTDPFKYKIDCGSMEQCDKAPSMYYNSTSATKAIPFNLCAAYDVKNGYCLAVKEPFKASCEGQSYKCEKEHYE